MSDPVIRFRGVNKSFGPAAALREVEFDVLEGKCMGLAGLNGAGKTTLIKCLLDFCSLDAGTIEVRGVGHHRPQARAGVAFLPERFTAPYFLTGREFIAMMLRFFGRRYDEDEVGEMFSALDLDSAALGKPVRTFSKGMTQKLGLAACFLAGRDVYVLDEPMSGLDAKARVRTKDLMTKLRAAGRTLLFTSHSLADIDEVCDDITILHRGMLAYCGAPRRLCERHGETSLERAFLKCIEAHA